MTKKLQRAIDAVRQLPEEEQDRVADEILSQLAPAEEAEIEPYASLKFLRDANLSLSPDASVTYERELYGREADLDA